MRVSVVILVVACCFLIEFVGFLPAAEAVGKKILLYPSKDTIACNSIGHSIQNHKAWNNSNSVVGRGETFYISAMAWTNKDRPFVQRGFVAFDLAIIPANAVISRAELTLYGIGHEPHKNSKIIGLKSNAAYLERVTTAWEEDSLTWYNQPSSTPVGRLSLEASTSPHQNYIIDITSFVRGWVHGSYENHGLVLRLQKEKYYARLWFASRDNLNISKYPTLEITYRLPRQK